MAYGANSSVSTQMVQAQTRTVKTSRTTTSYTVLYIGYLKTLSGILKLAQLICAIAIVILLGICHNNSFRYYLEEAHHLFFFSMAVTFLIITFCIVLSYILSSSTYQNLGPHTHFELIFNSIAFIMCLASSIIFLTSLGDYSDNTHKMFMIAGVIGLVLSGLYLISAIKAR